MCVERQKEPALVGALWPGRTGRNGDRDCRRLGAPGWTFSSPTVLRLPEVFARPWSPLGVRAAQAPPSRPPRDTRARPRPLACVSSPRGKPSAPCVAEEGRRRAGRRKRSGEGSAGPLEARLSGSCVAPARTSRPFPHPPTGRQARPGPGGGPRRKRRGGDRGSGERGGEGRRVSFDSPLPSVWLFIPSFNEQKDPLGLLGAFYCVKRTTPKRPK